MDLNPLNIRITNPLSFIFWNRITVPLSSILAAFLSALYMIMLLQAGHIPCLLCFGVFPSDSALLKALYLSTFEATKKWTMPIRNWGQVYGELSIMYEGRLPE